MYTSEPIPELYEDNANIVFIAVEYLKASMINYLWTLALALNIPSVWISGLLILEDLDA